MRGEEPGQGAGRGQGCPPHKREGGLITLRARVNNPRQVNNLPHKARLEI